MGAAVQSQLTSPPLTCVDIKKKSIRETEELVVNTVFFSPTWARAAGWRGGGGTICLQATAVADLEDKPQPRPNFLALGNVREMPQASIWGCPYSGVGEGPAWRNPRPPA